MSKTIEQLNTELDAPIPRSAVSQRQGGGGRSLSYLAGHYVIDRLNKVFGPLGWASEVKSLDLLFQGEVNGKHYVSYGATVRVVVQGPGGAATEHTDVGFGDGMDAHPGKPFELARKEAVTDALKRCAKNLGMSMGLALYDKEQSNVVEDEAPAPAKEKSAAKKSAPAPAPAASNRDKVLKDIGLVAKILVQQGRSTFDSLKDEMKKQFGTDQKEQLNDEQAASFLAQLKQQAS